MFAVQRCFSVLGNDLRTSIIGVLREKGMSVSEIAEELSANRSNVSHSLAILRDCGFVNVRKKGRNRVYSLSNCILNDMRVKGNIFELMEHHIRHYCREKCVGVGK